MSRIYITDLDGTLLNNEPILSDYSRKTICDLVDAGVNFTVASARNLASIQQLLGDLPLKLPVVEINGAFVSDYHTGHHFAVNQIPTDVCQGICELADQHDCMPFITAFNGQRDRLFYEGVCNDGMRWFLGDKTEGHSKNAKLIETIDHILHEQIVCFTIIGSYDVMKDLYDSVEAKYAQHLDSFFFPNPYSPEWYWLTIHDRNARKDSAVEKFIELEGFDISELTVFGDQNNDINMMKLNEKGATTIAVSNAIDEVKELASEIIASNEEDAVVKYILEREQLT